MGRLLGAALILGSIWFTAGTRSLAEPVGAGVNASNGQFASVTPVRVVDTRSGLGAPRAVVRGGASLPILIIGTAGVPASGVSAVAVTVTVAHPTASGYLTASGHLQPRPGTSNLTFAAGQVISGAMTITPGADGKADLFNGSSKPIDIIVDITGYYLDADQFLSSVGDPGRSQINLGETRLTAGDAAKLQPAWNHADAEESEGPPAIVDGIAYEPSRVSGTSGPQLDALDVTTGTTLWTVSLPNCSAPDGVAVAGETAFITCRSSGTLLAVRLDSHQLAWWRQVAAVQTYDAVTAIDGSVFVLNDSSSVEAFNAANGAPRFSVSTNGGFWFSARDGRLFVDGDDLRVYDDHSGAFLWSGTTDTRGPVTVDSGHVLVTNDRIDEFPEAGCGKTVCAPTWHVKIRTPEVPTSADCIAHPGAADGHTLAVSIDYCGRERVELINESTGLVTQNFYAPQDMVVGSDLVRFGNLLWVSMYHSTGANGFYAYDATCTGQCEPVARVLDEGVGSNPSSTIAASHGTLLIQHWSNEPNLVGFRTR